ncbi:SRPBCC family protein [Parafilimonas sp.]|uniref:SRPBCC family protein n=1 Tax=Parafilimonas sp. TaxID=1969739 RepID=UPI003F7F7C74
MGNGIVTVEKLYNAPVEQVWNALTDKEEMRKWYFNVSDFKPEKGFEFSFAGQGSKGEEYVHACKVLEVIPNKKLQYSWVYKGYPGYSVVTFELFEEGNTTRLKLTHEGLESFAENGPDFAITSFNGGWNEIVNVMLEKFLAKK